MHKLTFLAAGSLAALLFAAPAKADLIEFDLDQNVNSLGAFSAKVERLSSNQFEIRHIQAQTGANLPKSQPPSGGRPYTVQQVNIQFFDCDGNLLDIESVGSPGSAPFAGVNEADETPGVDPFAFGWRRIVTDDQVNWTTDTNADGNLEDEKALKETTDGHRIWSQKVGATITVDTPDKVAFISLQVIDGASSWGNLVQIEQCVPEPASLALVLPGVMPLAFALRRKLSRGKSEEEETEEVA